MRLARPPGRLPPHHNAKSDNGSSELKEMKKFDTGNIRWNAKKVEAQNDNLKTPSSTALSSIPGISLDGITLSTEIKEDTSLPPGRHRAVESCSHTKEYLGRLRDSLGSVPLMSPRMFHDDNKPPGLPLPKRAQRAILLWAEKSKCSTEDARNMVNMRSDGSVDMVCTSSPLPGGANIESNEGIFEAGVTLRDTEAGDCEVKGKKSTGEVDLDVADFRALDADGDGYITASELQFALRKHSAMSETDAKSSADRMIRSADKNGDRRLDFDEFVEVISSFEHGTSARRRSRKERLRVSVASPASPRRRVEDAPPTLDEETFLGDVTRVKSAHESPTPRISPRKKAEASFFQGNDGEENDARRVPYAAPAERDYVRRLGTGDGGAYCHKRDAITLSDMQAKNAEIRVGQRALAKAVGSYQYELSAVLDQTAHFFHIASKSNSRSEISTSCRLIRQIVTFWSRPYAFGSLSKSCKASLALWVGWIDSFDKEYGSSFPFVQGLRLESAMYKASLSAIASEVARDSK